MTVRMLVALAAALAGMAVTAGGAQAAPGFSASLSPGMYDPDDAVTRNAVAVDFALDEVPDGSTPLVGATVELPPEIVLDPAAGFSGCSRDETVNTLCPLSGLVGTGVAAGLLQPGGQEIVFDLLAYAAEEPAAYWILAVARTGSIYTVLEGRVNGAAGAQRFAIELPPELVHPAPGISFNVTSLGLTVDAVGATGRPFSGLTGCGNGALDFTGSLTEEGVGTPIALAAQAPCSVGDVLECTAGAMPRLVPGASAAVSVRCEDAAGAVTLSAPRAPARGSVTGVVQPSGSAPGSVRYTARTQGSDVLWIRATDGVAVADVPVPVTIGPPPVNPDPPPDPPAGPTTAEITAALEAAAGKVPSLARLRRRGRFGVPFTAPAAGELAVRWSAKRRGKAVTIARGARAVDAGATSVRVKLTKAGRKLLKGRKRVRIAMRLRFTPAGGDPVTFTRKATLKR